MLSHREIPRVQKAERLLARRRSGGRMPPVGEITEKTDEDSGQTGVRSNSSARQPASDPKSQTAGPPNNRCDVAVSCPHSIFVKKIKVLRWSVEPTAQSGHWPKLSCALGRPATTS